MNTPTKWIQNFDALATTENRKKALSIAEAAIDAIDTKKIIDSSVRLEGDILSVQGEVFDLTKFKKIKIIGFGKASCEAAHALEQIMGSKINQGVVIGLNKIKCDYIETFAGTHPKPSFVNIEAGQKIFEIGSNSQADDLVIVIVSGGGSSLLCSSEDECDQEIRLYDRFISRGDNIIELNTVRKHISALKGGGLAKLVYPATVIGLIFSDVPGDRYDIVASGPTYKDISTVADAERIITKYNLGAFTFAETPKDDLFFKNVRNFILVSNHTALDAMKKKAESLGFAAEIVSADLCDTSDVVIRKIFEKKKPKTVVLGGGEPIVVGDKTGGSGGRCLFLGINALSLIDADSVFLPLASDGIDNSLAAGAVVDGETLRKSKELGLDSVDYARRFDSYVFFEKTGDIVFTGPTNANVSDLMILVTN
jgi:glycerate 2-kinase